MMNWLNLQKNKRTTKIIGRSLMKFYFSYFYVLFYFYIFLCRDLIFVLMYTIYIYAYNCLSIQVSNLKMAENISGTFYSHCVHWRKNFSFIFILFPLFFFFYKLFLRLFDFCLCFIVYIYIYTSVPTHRESRGTIAYMICPFCFFFRFFIRETESIWPYHSLIHG